MEERLTVLKNTFTTILDFKENNIASLQLLDSRIKKIKEMYADFIASNRDNLFVFTLDSFHFQGKLIDIEYEDVQRLFYAITNRMYCDYYKLFKIIIDYVKEYVPDKKLAELIKVNDNFPAYKDLEPFKQYDFQYIQNLHEIIIVVLTYLNTFIINKEHDLKIYQSKNKIGLNIDSFVNTFNFNNTVMKEKTALFITYIEFFHKLHTKYLKRFTTKLQLMMSQINNDIKLDNPNETKNSKKEILEDLKENNIDKKILRELKLSVYDEASIISNSDPANSKDSEGRSPAISEASDTYPEYIKTTSSMDMLEIPYENTAMCEYMSDLTDDFRRAQTPRFLSSKSKMAEVFEPIQIPQDKISNIETIVEEGDNLSAAASSQEVLANGNAKIENITCDEEEVENAEEEEDEESSIGSVIEEQVLENMEEMSPEERKAQMKKNRNKKKREKKKNKRKSVILLDE